MDSSADPDGTRDGTAVSPDLQTQRVDHGPDGAGAFPSLALDGFSGPLDHLLTLARGQKIDLARISLTTLIDQLAAALRQATEKIPLGQKGDWVVMAAWLVQLRSRLLLPADAPAQQQAAVEADRFRGRLAALDEIQALADWLERRPQRGRDVFTRGDPPSRAQSPDIFGHSVEAGQAIDRVEFLWASLALFDDAAAPDTVEVYRPRPFALYQVADARDRILRLLGEAPEGGPLERFLPALEGITEGEGGATLRRRSAWSSTFIASLELARQGDVVLGQGEDFEPIQVNPA